MKEALPLGIYVHLPWCIRKCPYCDFNSHALKAGLPEQDYIAALVQDLDREATRVPDRMAQTVFFGGGTPSLFSPAGVGQIISAIEARGLLVPDAEISMEANPGTVERGRFAEYQCAGVNRFSLGAQTFDTSHLAKLGRIHGEGEIRTSIEEFFAAGISNFNLDLMFGLPGQTVSEALHDLRLAVESGPAHISHYQLTIEPNTLFHRKPPLLPDDDQSWQMQTEGQLLLAAAGFEQYEVSAYAKAERKCAHNLNYWTYGDYLGIGAGAHGKLTDPATGRVSRQLKSRHPQQYIESGGVPVPAPGNLASADIVFEFMLNNLRVHDGFHESDFEARTGLAFDTVAARVHEAVGRGLMEKCAATGHWRASALGFRFLNDLQAWFLPTAVEQSQDQCLVP
jgi:oxygen-independent coproporphyrinogen-3 oxidase